jgi:hypothetical protein
MSEGTQTAPASASTGTVEEAASAIEALLSGKKHEKRQSAPQAEAASEAATDDQDQPAADEDNSAETPTSDESEDDGADDASTPESDETDEGDDQPEPLYTVKINGKEEQVTLKEALNGYQRNKDYTEKQMALAAERKEHQSLVQQAQESEKLYSQLLPVMVQRMQATLPPPPDPRLIDENPSAYLRSKENYEAAMADLQAAASEAQRMQQKDQVEHQKRIQTYVAENASKLPELVPEWKDQKAYERDRPKVRDYLKTRGFSDEEINQAYDARLVAMAADGMRWRELQSKSKPRPNAPPLEKALKPAPAPAQPQVKGKREAFEARKRLASSGRVEDAAAAIKALL